MQSIRDSLISRSRHEFRRKGGRHISGTVSMSSLGALVHAGPIVAGWCLGADGTHGGHGEGMRATCTQAPREHSRDAGSYPRRVICLPVTCVF